MSLPSNFSEVKELTNKTINTVIEIAKFAFKWTIGLPIAAWNYATSKPINPTRIVDLTEEVNKEPSINSEVQSAIEEGSSKESPALTTTDTSALNFEEKSANSQKFPSNIALLPQKLYQKGERVGNRVYNQFFSMLNTAKNTATTIRQTLFSKEQG